MQSKIQKLYAINLLADFLVSLILALYFILYALSIIQGKSDSNLIGILIILAIFFLLNLLLWILNSSHKLKAPDFISQRFLKALPAITFMIFVLVFVSGILLFPHAPITAHGNIYMDKIGNSNYTYEQFRNFQKWEVGYMTAWSILALQNIVILPFYDIKSKTWRYGR